MALWTSQRAFCYEIVRNIKKLLHLNKFVLKYYK